MESYKKHHYVPQWYQYRFFNGDEPEKKFFYLDMKPETVPSQDGRSYKRKSLLRWGPPKCFFKDDLYTTRFRDFRNRDIEEKFFGKIDANGKEAVEYFSIFQHPSANGKAFESLLVYMSTQKLRTPKGLLCLTSLTGEINQNSLLFKMQELKNLHCAFWTECVWNIVDASQSATQFIVSDHPVTVYNQACHPDSGWYSASKEPYIWLNGTQTIFPLNIKKALILTNLSWVRNPYGKPLEKRPNPNPFRNAMFYFPGILTGHMLLEHEVVAINYIIKKGANRYLAAAKEEWLYPEKKLSLNWGEIGTTYILMPDPRSVDFSDEFIIGYDGGRSEAYDEYGRRPWSDGFQDRTRHDLEWETSHAFQGEYARIFGPKRRGNGYQHGDKDRSEDDPHFHAYHLSLEKKYKAKLKRRRRRN